MLISIPPKYSVAQIIAQVAAIVTKLPAETPIEVWFQDDTRVG
jgi:hypothetical protein